MNRKAAARLRGQSGETIAETLVALLISALALMMLAGAITTASDVIRNSKEKMNAYYAKNEIVELKKEDNATGLVGVGLEKKDTNSRILLQLAAVATDNVNYFVNDAIGDKPVISYALKSGT